MLLEQNELSLRIQDPVDLIIQESDARKVSDYSYSASPSKCKRKEYSRKKVSREKQKDL